MGKNPEILEICVCETFETSPRMVIAVDLASLADKTMYTIWEPGIGYNHFFIRSSPTRGPTVSEILSLMKAA